MILTRRKFFSFFGTGVALLAKPDLFVPKMELSIQAPPEQVHVSWDRGELSKDTLYLQPDGSISGKLNPGWNLVMSKELVEHYQKNYKGNFPRFGPQGQLVI